MKFLKLFFVLLFPLFLGVNTLTASDSNESVIIKENNDLPLVQFTLLSKTGSAILDTKQGLSNLLKSIIEESPLSENIEKKGGMFSVTVNRDFISFNLTFLNSESQTVLKEFFSNLNHFNISPIMLSNAKKEQIDAITQENNDPTLKSYKIFQQILFKGHPYANLILGNEDSIKSITLNDVQTLLHQIIGQKNLTAIIVGNTKSISKSYITKLLTSLPNNIRINNNIPNFTFSKAVPVQTLIKEKELTQSFINVGAVTSAFTLENFVYFTLIQQMVGGGFNSRLFIELRQKRGIAYSPFAIFHQGFKAGSFDILFPTATKSTPQALEVVKSILESIKEKGFTPFELNIAKKIVLNSLYKNEETNSGITDNIVNNIIYSLSYDFAKNAENKIKSITLSDLNAFAQKFFKESLFIKVVLGK